jgi:hypothetical protein
LDGQSREGVKVRLYMVEQKGNVAAGVIEAFGGSLSLDPRFFQWSIGTSKRVFSPSERHRARFMSLGFGILDALTDNKTDVEKFKVLVYIQPDEVGNGWTGILLFSSHTKINMSPRVLTKPPLFKSAIPPNPNPSLKSFRELYISSFEYLSLPTATLSPFYTIHNLLRLNCYYWSQIITSIRDEDQRINGISDTTVGHAEEIQKSLAVVKRGGSLGWKGKDEELTVEARKRLEEDFEHLVGETELLWTAREKMATIRQRKSETRWTALTNTFTYVFAPVTIVSGVYGMNVSQISGSTSNPNIWQFFVAVLALNALVVLALAASNLVHVQLKHRRTAGLKEVLGFAVGKMAYENK